LIDPINCPHCSGKIVLKSNTNEIVKIPKDMLENLKNETLGMISIDENLQVIPISKVKNIRVQFEKGDKKDSDEIMNKAIDDYFDNYQSYRTY